MIRSGPERRVPAYAWLVFALTFGLLISDYMARQVLNAVFPLLKAEWALSDSQLGLLSGSVAIMVGLLTIPLSLLADRTGRVRSITAMAILWSVATLICGLAQSYGQMLGGRLLVGVGEAAYGSVGIAVVITVFPKRLRGTLSAAFMAGGLMGQVLGVGIGGSIAASHGWRTAFVAIAVGGLLLGLLYPVVVRQDRIASTAKRVDNAPPPIASHEFPPLRQLFAGRALNFAYLASGLQLFVAAALPAWLPSFFNRYYGLPVAGAATLAALFLAICGTGMIICGAIGDRFFPDQAQRLRLAIGYSLASAVLLSAALALPPGPSQLIVLGLAMFLAAATCGPAGAMIAGLTPAAIHGTAFATLTLANNLLGLAPGPIVTGWLADRVGLLEAMGFLPLASLLAAGAFLGARQPGRTRAALATSW